VKFILVRAAHQHRSEMQEKQVVALRPMAEKDVLKLNSLKIGQAHVDNLVHILCKTFPHQPRILQSCLRTAAQSQAAIGYESFDQLLRNIGVFLDSQQERVVKELFLDRRLIRVASFGDYESDVGPAHPVRD
jgi:hypothetical protein